MLDDIRRLRAIISREGMKKDFVTLQRNRNETRIPIKLIITHNASINYQV